MKKIFLVIAFISIAKLNMAQKLKYISSPELDKFVGTWVYSENGQSVKIILKKVQINLKDITTEEIEGYHTFIVNNKTIENSFGKKTFTLTNGSNVFNSDINNTNQITLSFFDSTKNKGGKVTLTFLPGKSNEIKWNLRSNKEGPIIHKHNENKEDRSFTLPTLMILTKTDN